MIVADPFELKIFFRQGDQNRVRMIMPCFEKQSVKIFCCDLNPCLRVNLVVANGSMSSNQSGDARERKQSKEFVGSGAKVYITA